jgi:hypothetical protein
LEKLVRGNIGVQPDICHFWAVLYAANLESSLMSATAGLSATWWPLRELTDLMANGGAVSQPSPSMEEDSNSLFLSQYKNIFINRYLFQILRPSFEEVQHRRSPSQLFVYCNSSNKKPGFAYSNSKK